MKLKELINHLNTFDPELEIKVFGDDQLEVDMIYKDTLTELEYPKTEEEEAWSEVVWGSDSFIDEECEKYVVFQKDFLVFNFY